jgi:hypothetical protein
MVVTGTSLSESTAVPVLGDTEVIPITVAGGQEYQTSKKWLEVTSIDVTSGTITGINYDIHNVGYTDIGNTNFKITGYRVEALAAQAGGSAIDMTFIIEKIQDDGSSMMSVVPLEDISVNNGNPIVVPPRTLTGNSVTDHLRTGGSDRSYTMTSGVMGGDIWQNGDVFVLKQTDFDTFFTSNENEVLAGSADEGVLIRILGNSLGAPGGAVYFRVQVRYEFI